MRLSWRGPLAPGTFPADSEAFAALLVPAVYLRVKRYASGRAVVYVGQTRTLLARIDQHLGQLFSFAVALRDDDGRVVFRGEAGERIAVTSHGRVVAELVPPALAAKAGRRPYDELLGLGVIQPAVEDGDPLEDWPDIRLPRGTAAALIDSDRGEA